MRTGQLGCDFDRADMTISDKQAASELAGPFPGNHTPEEMKAWGQNLGHSDVLTIFMSYGTGPAHRQGDLTRMRGTSGDRINLPASLDVILEDLRRDAASN